MILHGGTQRDEVEKKEGTGGGKRDGNPKRGLPKYPLKGGHYVDGR